MPVIKDCSAKCRPARCECESKHGFVRAHDGACIHRDECEMYSLMSQMQHGQHFTPPPPSTSTQRAPKTTTKPTKKATQPAWKQFDEPPPTSPLTPAPSDQNESSDPLTTTNSPHEEQRGLPPSIAPPEYGHLQPPSRHEYEYPPTVSFDQVAAPTQPTVSSDEEEQGGYKPPSSTYGARPFLPGVVSADRYYVPKRPSSQSPGPIGAPSGKPQAPGTTLNQTPYQFAYAPSSPVLMNEGTGYALYPPQRFRIYRHRRDVQMPLGPPLRR
ncbi:hypothetical protein M3Y99_01457500 [Aphelenchoides fujianensis]|nr:hypothetical protein M3Y99_01457500 [Aphelenchoides fujianensis]